MIYDITVPKNNEKELLARAVELGYDGVIFLYSFKTRSEITKQKKLLYDIRHKSRVGIYFSAKKPGDIDKISNQLYLEADLVALTSKDENVIRAALSSPKIDLVFGIVSSGGRDHTHFRNSNLNHIMADLGKRNNVSYSISFSYILNVVGRQRTLVIGREMQNIRICKKRMKLMIASFAREESEIRNPNDLSALCSALKADTKSAADSIVNLNNIVKRKEFMRSKQYVRPGVKLVV